MENNSLKEMHENRNPTFLILILLIVAFIGIILFVMFFYRNHKESLTEKVQNDINTITDLKSTQIENWRKERIDDGDMISANRMLSDMIRLYHKKNTEEIQNDILYWLNTLTQNSNYKNAMLVDNSGKLILSVPIGTKIPGKFAIKNIEHAAQEKKVFLSDFHFYEATDTVHLDLIIPLITNYDSEVKELLMLEMNPYDFLYPMIQTWPTASETAECLIIKKDGNDALYLNDLKYRKDAALKFRVSGDNENVLSIKAINGYRGITEGIDYQNKPVIGVIKPVAGTDWFLISKIEKGELYFGINQFTTYTIVLISLFLIIVGSFILFLLNRQKAMYYRSLYESEAKREALVKHYEYVVKYANDMMVLIDMKLNLVEANDRAVSVYGYTKEELLKLNIRNLRPPELQDEVQSIFNEVLEKGGLLFEGIHVKKDGTKFPVEVSSREIKIDGNSFFHGIIRDITERKKTEEKITNLNRIYAILSQVNQSIVWTENRDKLFDRICEVCIKYGKFLFAWIGVVDKITHKVIPAASSGHSEGYLDIIKLSDIEEPEGRGPTGRAIREEKYIVCNDIEMEPQMPLWRAESLKRGYRSFISFPLKCAGKVIGNLNLYSDKINFFKEEEITLFEEVMHDISYALDNFEKESQKRNAIEALFISEKKFKTVFENANDSIMLIEENKIIDFNKKTEELFGFNQNELLNKTPLDLSPEKQKDNISSKEKFGLLTKEAYNGKPEEFEWLLKKADGSIFDAEVSLNSIQLGSKIMIIAITRDITAKKRIEEEILIAKEKAEEMNRLKSTFLANMSHELRTPMTGILGFADILYNELSDKGYKEMAGIILNGGKRLTSTLNSILDLSRVEADKMELKLETTNLSQVVKDSVELFRAAAKEKGLLLSEDIEENIYLEIDVRIFDHIITNLIQNAVVYTERGSISVKLNLEKINGSEQIVLKITDTGIGIPENLVETIFEPFRQVSIGLARKYEGTGLGLTLTKKFIEIMNGEISVKSKLGEGSTFTVHLPVISNSTSQKTISESNDISNINVLKQMDKKVLLVEDDKDTVLTIQFILKNICDMDTVLTGYEAIEMSKKNKYDLILMDIGLKGMSGLEAALEIKKLPGYKDTPIVAVTAYAMVGDKEKFLEGGCTHYISKPFNINEFKNTIFGLL